MAVTWQTAGTYDTGTASCAPGIPASTAVGDLLIIGCAFGNGDDTALDTPSGWTFITDSLEFGGDGGAYGTDAGNRGVIAFMRIADGTEGATVTVTNPGTGNNTRVTSAQIMRFTKTEDEFVVTASNGEDNTDGTGYSATADSVLIPANGDQGIAITAWNPDSSLPGTPTLTWDGVATSCTQAQAVASTQGADVRFLIFRRNLAGTGGSAPIFATTAGLAVTGATAFILIHDQAAAAATPVEPDDAAHAHAATSPTLTQHQVLAPANGAHAHAATSPTLTQHQVLAPANGAHAHAATSPTLTQHQVLAVDNTAHTHSATEPTLEPKTSVTPDNAAHAHSASSPTLTQHHILAPADAAHDHAATSPTLTQHQALSVDNAAHAHAATSPTLTQHQVLAVDNATHAHTASQPSLAVGGAIAPDSGLHTHSATSPTLTQHQVLSVASSAHTHAATEPTLTQRHVLTVASSSHAHAATSPTLTQHHTLTPDDATHGHTATSPTITPVVLNPVDIEPTASIADARWTADIAAATYTATITPLRYAATIAPARYTARIEDT